MSKKKSWYSITNQADSTEAAQIDIHDVIGDWGITAEDFLDEFAAIGKSTPINVSLHSPGGSVFDALAIHSALSEHPANVKITVRGLAASAASWILMAGTERVMPENAFIMTHNPKAYAGGESSDLSEVVALLKDLEQTCKNIYQRRTGQDDQTVGEWMTAKKDKWFTGAEALAAGLVDRLTSPVAVTQSMVASAERALGADGMPTDWRDKLAEMQAKAQTPASTQEPVQQQTQEPTAGGQEAPPAEATQVTPAATAAGPDTTATQAASTETQEGNTAPEGVQPQAAASEAGNAAATPQASNSQAAQATSNATPPVVAAPQVAYATAEEIKVFQQACKHPSAGALASLFTNLSVPEPVAREMFAALSKSGDVVLAVGQAQSGTTATKGFASASAGTGGQAKGGEQSFSNRLDLEMIYNARKA